MTATVGRLSGSPPLCEPRWATPRSTERFTFGHKIIEVAETLGLPPMPWQRQVMLVGGEIDLDTGLPAYRAIVFTTPRQSGKTTVVLPWEVQRGVGFRHLGPQRISYSAQTGNDARKKLIEDQFPILKPRKNTLGIRRLLSGMGNEAVEWVNGSRITLLASTEGSGHGPTVHLGVKDELWHDTDDRRDQALVPAMATVASAQELTASTMGTDASDPWNTTVEQGRQAVANGVRSGIAYFEFAADPKDDPDDPAVWLACMPALCPDPPCRCAPDGSWHHTITEAVVRHARSKLKLAEFRRAFMNLKDGRRSDPVIDEHLWEACRRDRRRIKRPDELALAFDVSPDGVSGAIGAAGSTPGGMGGKPRQIDVFDHRPGTGWMIPTLTELRDRYKPPIIVCDPAGPAGALLPQLKRAGFEVVAGASTEVPPGAIRLMSTREHQQACGGFYNDLKTKGETLVHFDHPGLNAAVDGADRRMVGDSWLWSRKTSSVDICPLVAVTEARWAHLQASPPKVITEDNLSIY